MPNFYYTLPCGVQVCFQCHKCPEVDMPNYQHTIFVLMLLAHMMNLMNALSDSK